MAEYRTVRPAVRRLVAMASLTATPLLSSSRYLLTTKRL